MQVNNNVQSPNFGMALKISKGAQKALEQLPMETIESLQKAGQELKDTKFYHVKVDDDLKAAITADKDAYFGLFPKRMDGYSATRHGECKAAGKIVPEKDIIMIDNEHGTIAGVSRKVPYGESAPFFNCWGPYGAYNELIDIKQLTKLAKMLDDVAAEKAYQKAAKEAAELAEKKEVAKAVGNLLDAYGV